MPIGPLIAHALLAAVLWAQLAPAESSAEAAAAALPEFDEPRASRWIHSQPLTVKDLAGHVALVEVWTFGCVNCVRTMPWIREVRRRYADRGLLVIGVHTPELDYEHELRRVRDFAEKEGLDFPILVDNEMRYWERLRNRYWPTVYLVDHRGRIRHVHVGETHAGTERATGVERVLEELLAEAAASSGVR